MYHFKKLITFSVFIVKVMNMNSRNCLNAGNGIRVQTTKCDKASGIQVELN